MADGRDMPHATFVRPPLGSFCRLDELGLQVVEQRPDGNLAVPSCCHLFPADPVVSSVHLVVSAVRGYSAANVREREAWHADFEDPTFCPEL
jgi:hypothetical protein